MRDLLAKKPSVNSVAKKCERLAQLEAQLDEALLPFATRKQHLDEEIEAATRPLTDQISLLEKEIKRDALEIGHTIDTPTHQVQYVQGRRTWDTRGLQGYMVAGHPELEEFYKTGNPSAKIKKIENTDET